MQRHFYPLPQGILLPTYYLLIIRQLLNLISGEPIQVFLDALQLIGAGGA